MRANRFGLRITALALLLGGWAGHFTTASASEVNIFPVTQVWKYMASTTAGFCLDGTGWETVAYDDSTWPSGPGGFTGGETAANALVGVTTMTLPAPGASGGAPQYFRTHFSIVDPTGVFLTMSNRVDDNMVVYLNGTRIADVRYPTVPAVCATFGGGGGEATVWEVITRSPAQLAGILQAGDNVLAVSVGQNGAGSSDMVFAMNLTAIVNPPPPPPPISYTNMAGPITFDTAPPVSQWSTIAWSGAANGTADTQDIVSNAVQMLSAANITTPLPNAAGNPPGTSGSAQYASDAGALYVVTHPTGTLGDILMATLTNNSGGPLTGLSLTYTLTVTAPLAEQVKGHLVFYSLTGAAGSWVLIPELSNQANDDVAGTYTKSADVFFTPSWAANTVMYFLWADDNGSGAPDGALGIDNVKWSTPAPPIITDCSSITNQSVVQCRNSATMSVTSIGGSYQWTHNGVDIPGATSSSYTISNMTSGLAGQYAVRVFNALGTTSCPPATVTYVADTTPPTLVYSLCSTDLVTIILKFSEAVTAADPTFDIHLTNIDTLTVYGFTAVTNPDPMTIVLTADQPLNFTDRFQLGIDANEITDCPGNVMPTISVALSSIRTVLFPQGGSWRYNDIDVDPGANWTQKLYDDSGWASGPAPFDAKRDATVPDVHCRPTTFYGLGNVGTCINLTSPVTQTNLITAYFRTHFTYPGNPGPNAILELRGKTDDGAIFHLNGAEITPAAGRLRMPAGAITRTTFANVTVNDGDPEDAVELIHPPTLTAGDNVLSVEMHQVSITSSDLTMGYEIRAVTGTPFLKLTIVYDGNNDKVTITWAPTGGTLQYTDNLQTPPSATVWTTIAGAVSGYMVNSVHNAAAHRFYRVVQ